MNRPSALWVHLRLPPPISTNELFVAFNKGGRSVRVKSPNYKKWIAKAYQMIALQNPYRVEGPYGLRIVVPAKTRMDISNAIKAVEDVLVSSRLTDDDRYCQNIEIRKGTGEFTEVSIISTREIKQCK